MSSTRIAIGFVGALAVAIAARKTNALSPSGSLAATIVGVLAVAAGWSWAALLLLYFASSIALTRTGALAKAARTGSVVAKGGARDAAQVAANGGVFAVACALWIGTGWSGWQSMGAGALAAATSDTWATEIGTLARRSPRSLLTWRPVPAGTSGGVSAPGTLAALAGALFLSSAALVSGWPPRVAAAAFLGGVFGSTLDSVLGATIQVRRWCDRCRVSTERITHTCGSTTRIVSGMRGVDNDSVNALATAGGGLLALLVAA